jgi:hypothetical protein
MAYSKGGVLPEVAESEAALADFLDRFEYVDQETGNVISFPDLPLDTSPDPDGDRER